MAVLKVHGSPVSTATMRVLSVLHEKGLEFEFVLVDMPAGAHKKEPFLSLNPFGQVPAFEDGDVKMFESRAITQYLAHTYDKKGTKLLFQDPKKMADQLVWTEVEAHKFDTVASKLAFELVFKPMLGKGAPNEAAAAELQESLGKVLDVYEARLARATYVSGDDFGLADVHHQPVLHYLMNSPAKAVFECRPGVNKWAADILARPAWAKVVALQKSG
uniref:glutathione transferase n=1 Tax=Anthurium amnicola TaxID=1678845 RepID=A0A1D1YAG5_9ARAE